MIEMLLNYLAIHELVMSELINHNMLLALSYLS